MSGGSYKSYGDRHRGISDLRSDDASTRKRAKGLRSARIAESRGRIDEGRTAPLPERDVSGVYDEKLVRSRITCPTEGAERLHVVIIDNSGSNRVIADHLKASSGYLLSTLLMLDPKSQVAFLYYSDHCDGDLERQDIDYVFPDEDGDKVVHSTLRHTYGACGGDAPEAFECALWDVCDLDFGEVQERHLYLVTDVVAHGMGMRGDDGCPHDRSWKESLARVQGTFKSFQVVGCGNDPSAAKLQEKFIEPERLAMDLIDLSEIPTHQHRCGITGNALLFLMARHRGLQTVESFLMALYEKWLTEPIFGANTDLGAQEAIRRFTKYLDAPTEDIERMLEKIFT